MSELERDFEQDKKHWAAVKRIQQRFNGDGIQDFSKALSLAIDVYKHEQSASDDTGFWQEVINDYTNAMNEYNAKVKAVQDSLTEQWLDSDNENLQTIGEALRTGHWSGLVDY